MSFQALLQQPVHKDVVRMLDIARRRLAMHVQYPSSLCFFLFRSSRKVKVLMQFGANDKIQNCRRETPAQLRRRPSGKHRKPKRKHDKKCLVM